MAVFKRGNIWWYKFNWQSESVRQSTKQTNRRVAVQMEAAHKTSLAKGEVGIRDKKPIPTLRAFTELDFIPHIEATFKAKEKTLSYYKNGAKWLLSYPKLADEAIDQITSEKISGYIAKRQADGLKVSSINRELQVLRRMFALVLEWGKVDKVLPRVRMIAGEAHRERVLTPHEEAAYLKAAPLLLRDIATILLDCALRPEECFRLRWVNIREGSIEILTGKTTNARRHLPMSGRVTALLDLRKSEDSESEWVFPAPTKSGHAEPSSIKKQQVRACGPIKPTSKGGTKTWTIQPFPLYTLRHTCLTRWAPHMDPWTLSHLAGHRDMTITRRYIHPQPSTILDAMEKARSAQSGHRFGHSDETKPEAPKVGVAVIN